MTTLDRMYGGGTKQDKRSALDEMMREDEETKVKSLRMLDADALELEKKTRLARLQKELKAAQGTTGIGSFGEMQEGGSNTGIELMKFMVKQGMDVQKANEFISNLDDDTLMKLQMLSGSQSGVNQMMPLLLLGRKKDTSITDMLSMMTFIFDRTQNKGKTSEIVELATAVNTLRPEKPDSNPQIQAVLNKVDTLVAQNHQNELALREALHDREMTLTKTIADMQQNQLNQKLAEMSAKIEEVKNVKPMDYVKDAKEMLESVGLSVGGAAAKDPLEEATALVDTVFRSPGMNKVFDATASRIQAGIGQRRQPVPQAPPPPVGTEIICDICQSRGIRTVLPVTPAVLSGQEGVTCPECHNTFWRQGSKGGQQSPPPPPPPSDGSGNKFTF